MRKTHNRVVQALVDRRLFKLRSTHASKKDADTQCFVLLPERVTGQNNTSESMLHIHIHVHTVSPCCMSTFTFMFMSIGLADEGLLPLFGHLRESLKALLPQAANKQTGGAKSTHFALWATVTSSGGATTRRPDCTKFWNRRSNIQGSRCL